METATKDATIFPAAASGFERARYRPTPSLSVSPSASAASQTWYNEGSRLVGFWSEWEAATVGRFSTPGPHFSLPLAPVLAIGRDREQRPSAKNSLLSKRQETWEKGGMS